MKGRWKSILAAASIAGALLVLAAGCVTTEVDETMPPYASISDEGREPASAPTPPPSASSSGDSGGFMSAIGSAIVYPFHLIGEAFGSSPDSTSAN